MARFTLADRQSATIFYESDDLDAAFGFVASILETDGVEGLEGLSLTVQDKGDVAHSHDNEVMIALQALQRDGAADGITPSWRRAARPARR